MNSFLHDAKPGSVSNDSEVICTVDTDSGITSTFNPDFGRHSKGAIFSHLDGHVTFADADMPEKAGRFACGKFPIQTFHVEDGSRVADIPKQFVYFEDPGTGVVPSIKYVVAGPYGVNDPDLTTPPRAIRKIGLTSCTPIISMRPLSRNPWLMSRQSVAIKHRTSKILSPSGGVTAQNGQP